MEPISALILVSPVCIAWMMICLAGSSATAGTYYVDASGGDDRIRIRAHTPSRCGEVAPPRVLLLRVSVLGGLADDPVLDRRRRLLVVGELDVEAALATGHAREIGCVR